MKRNKSFVTENNLLYLLATPIGNLKEVSPRFIETIEFCDVIAAEDTRNTASLLAKFGIKKEIISLREHNESSESEHVILLIKSGKKVAYVSDAGYPGISDPGHILVKKCLENDIRVSTINGPSAFINALVGSGLDTMHFYFHGFLSPKENEAKEELETLKNKEETLIFYESPHRIEKTLSRLAKILGNRRAAIGRELTKINEEFIYGTLTELSTLDPATLIGEMVIIVEGNKNTVQIPDNKIIERVKFFISKGLSNKDSVEIVSEEYKINKNYIKKLII